MVSLFLGAVVLLITVGLFWYCLPRDGKLHRFVGTALEPYVAVAFCAGVALSFSMMLSGFFALTYGGALTRRG
jgi:hypothetical protein